MLVLRPRKEGTVPKENDNLIKRGTEKFEIKIKPSHAEKCLQAADFISWSIFRKYEMNDYEYYEIIKNKIIEENLLFP